MNSQLWNMKGKCALVMVILFALGGCLIQEDLFRRPAPENSEQCVTPIRKRSMNVSSGGISAASDGWLFGVAGGDVSLFTNQGELLWTREGIGSTYALLPDDGTALFAESYNKEESWRSTLVKFDTKGNILWERQTGLIGDDGLAVSPDGSFIAVGATDKEKKGHLMLFDQDGNTLWDHQIDGRIETVAVSKSGYVVAGPQDLYVYVYDCNSELVFKYFANSFSDSQDVAISPDESFFLFGSEHKYLNCYTFEGDRLWQAEMGPLCNIRISADGEYVAVGTSDSRLFLFDRNGNELWSKKVTDAFFVHEVAISAHGEYIAINMQKGIFPTLHVVVYSNQGELLWQYEGSQPFMAVAMSSDGHYVAAGNGVFLLFFDNFQAIEEYAQSECEQPDASLLIC